MLTRDIAKIIALEDNAPSTMSRPIRFTQPDAAPRLITRQCLGLMVSTLRKHHFPPGYSFETVGGGQ